MIGYLCGVGRGGLCVVVVGGDGMRCMMRMSWRCSATLVWLACAVNMSVLACICHFQNVHVEVWLYNNIPILPKHNFPKTTPTNPLCYRLHLPRLHNRHPLRLLQVRRLRLRRRHAEDARKREGARVVAHDGCVSGSKLISLPNKSDSTPIYCVELSR